MLSFSIEDHPPNKTNAAGGVCQYANTIHIYNKVINVYIHSKSAKKKKIKKSRSKLFAKFNLNGKHQYRFFLTTPHHIAWCLCVHCYHQSSIVIHASIANLFVTFNGHIHKSRYTHTTHANDHLSHCDWTSFLLLLLLPINCLLFLSSSSHKLRDEKYEILFNGGYYFAINKCPKKKLK